MDTCSDGIITLKIANNNDWRQESGLLLSPTRTVPPDASKRIWNNDDFRVFLSHKSEVKKETAVLKTELGAFGISAFVAHEDIHPTKTWQDEIENALATMDAFVALLTDKFHDSNWTDQEVGYAVARGVPIIAVKLGKDPYGFIGKFQALSAGWTTASVGIAKHLISNERMFGAYIRALSRCRSWDEGNLQAKALAGLERITSAQSDELVTTYNETRELQGCYGFTGTRSSAYGPGLVHYLNSLDSRSFKLNEKKLVVVV